MYIFREATRCFMTICSVKQLIRLVLFSVLFFPALAFAQGEEENNSEPGATLAAAEENASASSASSQPLPKAESINLGEVIPELQTPKVVAASSEESSVSPSSGLTSSSSAQASSLPAAPAPATSVSSSSAASAPVEQTVTASSVANETALADGDAASSVDTPEANPESDYYDPKSSHDAPRWFSVDINLQEKFPRTILLAEIKQHPLLADMVLLRQGRLSIQPVTPQEWKTILKMQ